MKYYILYCLFPLTAWQTCSVQNNFSGKEIIKQEIIKDTVNFTSHVQPILVKNCSPCHFTGGKMYERMPFDKDTTIINHEKGILRRIKGDENLLIKYFIQQNKNGSSTDKPSH